MAYFSYNKMKKSTVNYSDSTHLENITEFKRSINADIWLLVVCVIWGLSFPLVKTALNDISPLLFLSIRFWLGALVLLPFVRGIKHQMNLDRLLRGGLIGLFMFLGMLFQTFGLKYTTASNSGFITGMAVVMVPVLVVLIERRRPKWPVLLGVVFAVAGLYFLTQPQTKGVNKGDLLTLACAFSFSFEIVFIELLVKKNEEFFIALAMIVATALLATFSSLVFEEQFIRFTRSMVAGLGFVAVFCTALGFTLQTYWQPKTSATAASVIYTSEPVFAAIFAAVILHERFDKMGYLGAGLIIAGMLITELRRKF